MLVNEFSLKSTFSVSSWCSSSSSSSVLCRHCSVITS